jgi:hypothetical protein
MLKATSSSTAAPRYAGTRRNAPNQQAQKENQAQNAVGTGLKERQEGGHPQAPASSLDVGNQSVVFA